MNPYEAKFTELLKKHYESVTQQITEKPRKTNPHIAVLTFKIDVRELDNQGIMGESILSKSELLKYGMSNKAQILIKGETEADCIKKVKDILENIDAKSR